MTQPFPGPAVANSPSGQPLAQGPPGPAGAQGAAGQAGPAGAPGPGTASSLVVGLGGVTASIAAQFQSVHGYTAINDGGGGPFFWNSGDTRTTPLFSGAAAGSDGGTYFPGPGGAVAPGRWNRLFSGWLNAHHFGAKGDGSTDDTAAIQMALDAARVASTGGPPGDDVVSPAATVFLPAGEYLISATLEMVSGVSLRGEPGTVLTAASTGVNLIRCAAVDQVIEGITFDKSKSAILFFGPCLHYVIPLSGTCTVTNGNASITFSSSQSLASGTPITFSSQAGVVYVLSGPVSGTSGTLTTNYTGGNSSTAVVSACTNLSPDAATQCVVRACKFLHQAAPTFYCDTSVIAHAGGGKPIFDDCFFQTCCAAWIGFDAAQFRHCYFVVSQLVANDSNTVIVKDDHGKILPFIVSFDNVTFVDCVGVTLGVDDTQNPRSAYFGGSGTFRGINNRWGGDAGNIDLCRLTTSLYTLNGQTLASITSSQNLSPSVSMLDGPIACTSGHNLAVIHDHFPKLLDFRNQELSVQTGLPLPGPAFLSVQSYGIFCDSATLPSGTINGVTGQPTFTNVDRRNYLLNFEGFAFDAFRFRWATDPTVSAGQDITANLRPFFRTPLPGGAIPTAGVPITNLWPANKVSTSNADYSTTTNTTTGDTETVTGYGIVAIRTTADDNNAPTYGFNNVTNGLVGEFTLSFQVAANYNGVVVVQQADPTAGTNAIALDIIPFEQGPSAGTTPQFQTVSTPIYCDGSSHSISFLFQHMPLHAQGTATAGEFYAWGFQLVPGRQAPPAYVVPQSTLLQDGVRSIIRYTSGTYTVPPNTLAIVDSSAGPVTLNLSVLGLGQAIEVLQDSSTALSHTITVNAGTGQSLSRPSSFSTFTSPITSTSGDIVVGEGLKWINAGSAGGKLVLD